MTENDSNPSELEELNEFDALDDIVEPGGGGPPLGAISMQAAAEPETEAVPVPSAPTVEYSAQILQRMYTGMPAPFFNVNAPKEYYRFLFGGILLVIGCLMPFDADWAHVGYKSTAGACCLLIGLGVVWSAWAAISTGMFRMKWVLLAFLPMVWSLIHLITDGPFTSIAGSAEFGWKQFFELWTDKNAEGRFRQMGNFLQHMGPGKIFICLGALMVEYTFIMGFFGGVKKMKEQKGQRPPSSRRR